jgi:flagellin-like hook-associated protein FlgL
VDLSNDTENHQQRLYGNLEVRQLLEELVALSQTRQKDGYVFSGKWSDQPPYEIKTGSAIYYAKPSTNEIPITISATYIPVYEAREPEYIDVTDRKKYEEIRMHLSYAGSGPVTFSILDSNYRDPNLPMDESLGEGYTNEWRNPIVQRIIPGSVAGLAGLKEKPQFDENGRSEDEYGIPYADYEIDYENGTITLLSGKAIAAFYDNNNTSTPPPPTNTTITAVRRDLNPVFDPVTGTYPPKLPTDTSDRLPKMDFDYVYRNSIDMSGEIYREIDTGISIRINADPDDLFGKGGLGDTDAFKEIISLMQGLWYNDQPKIANGIERVGDAAERNLAEQATEGARLNRLEMVKNRNSELKITNTGALSIIQDVDVAEALTQFSLAQAVYNASLYATSNLLQRSLMDYL